MGWKHIKRNHTVSMYLQYPNHFKLILFTFEMIKKVNNILVIRAN